MASPAVWVVEARCPLCGTPIDATGAGRDPRVSGAHLVSLHRHGDGIEGFLLCEECWFLADLRAGLTLN